MKLKVPIMWNSNTSGNANTGLMQTDLNKIRRHKALGKKVVRLATLTVFPCVYHTSVSKQMQLANCRVREFVQYSIQKNITAATENCTTGAQCFLSILRPTSFLQDVACKTQDLCYFIHNLRIPQKKTTGGYFFCRTLYGSRGEEV